MKFFIILFFFAFLGCFHKQPDSVKTQKSVLDLADKVLQVSCEADCIKDTICHELKINLDSIRENLGNENE